MNKYSFSDFLYNLKKSYKVYLIIFLILSIGMGLYIYKASNKSSDKNSEMSNYKRVLSYTPITEEGDEDDAVEEGGYISALTGLGQNKAGIDATEYITMRLSVVLDGAGIFKGVTEEKMEKIAVELALTPEVLQEMDSTYLSKYYRVVSSQRVPGFLLEIKSQSKTFNQLIENAVDKLIADRKDDLKKVKEIDKKTVSDSKTEKQEVLAGGKKKMILKLVLAIIFSAVLTSLINVLRYIFNPTLNFTDDFKERGIAYTVRLPYGKCLSAHIEKALRLMRGLIHDSGYERIAIVSSDERYLVKFQKNAQQFLDVEKVDWVFISDRVKDYDKIADADAVLAVEALGKTRHRKMDALLRDVNEFRKDIVGVFYYE